jgi:DNA polymerase-3 subunit alpha
VNQRSVNKKSIECLIYAGAFDSFKNLHRAQYFFTPPGEQQTTLEKIIQFGNRFQANKTQNTNTLFGDTMMMDIPTPKIAPCEEWSLTEKLNYEKEITGMFISGHPLDHFKFELRHYKLTTLEAFNEVKATLSPQTYQGQSYRIAGLVTEGQHRLTKNGKQFGILHLEDYTGKTEIALFGDDYVRHKEYFQAGTILYISGGFKARWNSSDQLEFKPEKFGLLEGMKHKFTKQITLITEAAYLDEKTIQFLENQVKNHPGSTGLKFFIKDEINQLKVNMNATTGITMNDELTNFLLDHPEFEVSVSMG